MNQVQMTVFVTYDFENLLKAKKNKKSKEL